MSNLLMLGPKYEVEEDRDSNANSQSEEAALALIHKNRQTLIRTTERAANYACEENSTTTFPPQNVSYKRLI